MLLGLTLTAPSVPVRPIFVQNETMLPLDGDAWTENNNATYVWTTVYDTDVLEFQTVDSVFKGGYSLKVKNTDGDKIWLKLELPNPIDVTDFEFFTFYYKINFTIDDRYLTVKWYYTSASIGNYK